ncbi:hypothetical protein PIB30_046533 [Stylosanthes scabra]|uniref:Uncharacterized protein n=1 Tax=Stylosanthes scabra TaxID=79078 RepID=A0ABU6RGJ3_9FABA|nr:hypothetical protein [Stylosanthes scabra]
MRTTELFVEILDPLASSGGFAPNLHSANVARPSRPTIQHDPEAHQAEATDCVGDLGDTRSFAELADTIAAAPHAVFIPIVERDPELLVAEALRANDSDDEPEFIEGNSDDESGPISI